MPIRVTLPGFAPPRLRLGLPPRRQIVTATPSGVVVMPTTAPVSYATRDGAMWGSGVINATMPPGLYRRSRPAYSINVSPIARTVEEILKVPSRGLAGLAGLLGLGAADVVDTTQDNTGATTTSGGGGSSTNVVNEQGGGTYTDTSTTTSGSKSAVVVVPESGRCAQYGPQYRWFDYVGGCAIPSTSNPTKAGRSIKCPPGTRFDTVNGMSKCVSGPVFNMPTPGAQLQRLRAKQDADAAQRVVDAAKRKQKAATAEAARLKRIEESKARTAAMKAQVAARKTDPAYFAAQAVKSAARLAAQVKQEIAAGLTPSAVVPGVNDAPDAPKPMPKTDAGGGVPTITSQLIDDSEDNLLPPPDAEVSSAGFPISGRTLLIAGGVGLGLYLLFRKK